jgi:hypothetical protein
MAMLHALPFPLFVGKEPVLSDSEGGRGDRGGDHRPVNRETTGANESIKSSGSVR